MIWKKLLETMQRGACLTNPDPLLRPEDGGTEIVLIRHGNAVPAAEDFRPGSYDAQPLSALGQRQAAAMAARFRADTLAAIYSSPILRARQTAEAISAVCDMPVMLEADLREVDLSAARPNFAATKDPAEKAAQLRAYLRTIEAEALRVGVWSAIPGVEPSAQVRARIMGALERIAARHPGQRVAAISHNGAINAAIAACLDLPRDFFFPAANTSLSVIRLRSPHRLVVTINDFAHLAGVE
jgi:probable phosphoglycerate mutase